MKEEDGLTQDDFEDLLDVLRQGNCWIKLSGPVPDRQGQAAVLRRPLGRALVAARPDRLIWGSDWPHLPNGQRDTGELLNLLADWAPDEKNRHRILVESPEKHFFS
ncbi:amidohydrolase family protein [Actinacidiphila soli]|uniref:amidohydrolase family protein n=1 Tax=Actinacidiphila soli TaxID=2487275 RepID=UPI001F0C3A5E|nr:amidohydrolase family protein [Actinacidiphila soli]